MDWMTRVYRFLVEIHPFVAGAVCALSLVASLLFLRFYKRTGDRLFGFFSAAFAVLGVNRMALNLVDPTDEAQSWLYVVRLAAFGLILYGIWDKNRGRGGDVNTKTRRG